MLLSPSFTLLPTLTSPRLVSFSKYLLFEERLDVNCPTPLPIVFDDSSLHHVHYDACQAVGFRLGYAQLKKSVGQPGGDEAEPGRLVRKARDVSEVPTAIGRSTQLLSLFILSILQTLSHQSYYY